VLNGTLPAAAPGTPIQDVFVFLPRPDVEDGTIIRTHLEGTINPKGLSTGASAGVSFAVGAAIVTFEASQVAGGTPNPASEVGATWDGWYMHQTYSWNGFTSTGFVENRHLEFDSKAMRKLNSGNVVIFSFGISNGAAPTGQIEYAFGGRFLLMLP